MAPTLFHLSALTPSPPPPPPPWPATPLRLSPSLHFRSIFSTFPLHLPFPTRPFPSRSFLCRQAKEPSAHHTSLPAHREDLDEEFDEEFDEEELDALFEEHGEVLISDPNPKPASAEVDDDAQSLALAVALAEAANDTKAVDILVLHVKPLVYWTRFFVIATAFSRPQLAAINKKMRDVGEERFKILPRGDTKPNPWTLLDYGDVVVHVFLPKERAFYNLEEFYGNATSVELPFESSPSP